MFFSGHFAMANTAHACKKRLGSIHGSYGMIATLILKTTNYDTEE
jgi:hypothetical protein